MAEEGELKFYRYHYIPKEVILTLDKNYVFRDGTVTYINLIFDFVNNRFPIIQGGIECDNVTIANIYAHQDIAKMRLVIDEQCITNDSEVVSTVNYLRKTFTLIPARDKTTYITEDDLDTPVRTDNMKLLQHFEFYLIDMESVEWFDAERNFSMKDTTYPAAFQSVFMARNIPGNIIVASPPVLDKELKRVVLPLDTLIGNLKYLNGKYGLYESFMTIFYDWKYLYCISRRDPNTQMEDTETDYGTVSFILWNMDDPHHKIRGSCNDRSTSTHFINLEGPPEITDMSMQDAYTKTAAIALVDKDGNVKFFSSQTGEEIDMENYDKGSTRLTYIHCENELSEKQVLNELITGPIVDLSVSDISIMFLKPYKDFNFQLDSTYQQLGIAGTSDNPKTFRLLRFTHCIHRNGSVDYRNETTMTLYCPQRDKKEEGLLTDTQI